MGAAVPGAGGTPELSHSAPGGPVLEPPRSRILAPLKVSGLGGVAVAVLSTAVVFGLIVWGVVSSRGWGEVRETFFNGRVFAESFPEIARRFLINVRAFLIAEVVILVLALFIAVLRSVPGAVFFPLRLLAAAYTDLFRAVPTILVVYLLGFGAPALQIAGVPKDPFFWGVVSLVLVYSAYVAEVYRAGIESVHPSQVAAARALGLGHAKTLRFVVVPQAVRRIVPPLLNDFIGLTKDTALIALIGVLEAFRRAQVETAGEFNFTPYVATAVIFMVFTIPLIRLVDWVVARERRRREAGGAA